MSNSEKDLEDIPNEKVEEAYNRVVNSLAHKSDTSFRLQSKNDDLVFGDAEIIRAEMIIYNRILNEITKIIPKELRK